MTRSARLLSALLLALLLPACAGTRQADAVAGATPAPTSRTDPLENTNRRIFDLNLTLDDAVIRPMAVLYRESLGSWTRTRIRNVLDNMAEPAVAANNLLQARPLAAGQSVMRFAINSTLGLGGMFDLAEIGGPPRQVQDFGITLHHWGLPDGPYLMVPVLGPSTPRELAGSIGNGFLNPVGWLLPIGVNLGAVAAWGLTERERNIETVDEIRNSSLDFYARLRSLWRQHRDAELGEVPAEEPEILEDPGQAAPALTDPAPPRAESRPTPRPQAALRVRAVQPRPTRRHRMRGLAAAGPARRAAEPRRTMAGLSPGAQSPVAVPAGSGTVPPVIQAAPSLASNTRR
ncbi:VacJ family lipoprotein [Siccirubricoccus sp. G192]|uniref:MlaA family lipoprotein n=1 Tax=Siccirubricoccus sp. G192 TaxID=2849651 RepID=UPI001C2BD330|nr:VacJ family lipoprotein [Siccirubricoccus sp. G192]MBV1796304.1 VacJ family lipoprotein [Siccirubricoccus sp. G192]